jgi:glycosyltransferase involved in cell wall biosynthesis
MILRPDADHVFGGDTVVMEKLSAALRDLGADVLVGRQDDMPPASEFDLLHIFTIAPLDHCQRMVRWAQEGGAAIVFSPLYYNDFRDWFARAVVHTPRWRSLAARLGRERAWQVYRLWQTARLPMQPSWRAMREALLAAYVIATTSQWENAWLASHFRLPPLVRSAMRLGRFGIDAELYGREFTAGELDAFRRKYGISEPYVVEVARIESKKNQLAVIEALWDDPIDLVFVGSVSPYFAPDYAQRCRAAAEQRDRAGGRRTRFLGWLPKAELPLVYAASAGHILPSWNELPGLASLEAGACGARVISTQYSPIREILGDEAWTVDPYDNASIRRTTLAALSSPKPVRLRARLLQQFNWCEAARVNLDLYKDVLTASSAR